MEPRQFRGAILAAIAAFFCTVVICMVWQGQTAEPQEPEGTYTLQLDCNNAAQMHAHGLPTKADVMEYHIHGQWAYYMDGVLMAFDRLPGSAETWDTLYQIEPNPAFDK